MGNNIFMLFTTCIPVKGAKNFVICDLQRSELYNIPEGLYEILTIHKGKNVEKVKSFYKNNFNEEIDAFYQYLINEELGFFCSDPTLYPEIDYKWKVPAEITNAIIEYDKDSEYNLKNLVSQLEDLGCRNVELRIYQKISLEDLKNVISNFNDTKIRFISLMIKFSTEYTPEAAKRLILKFQRIGNIIIHSSNTTYLENDHHLKELIFYTSKYINDNTHCGEVNPNYFYVNRQMYSESLSFNSCLNKKISINANGIVRNCPSMPLEYGNITTDSLTDIVNKEGFRKYWNINKDQIDICKDCEYRYVCTDCRAFVENDNNMFSKPKKCSYDPYTGIWENNNKNTVSHETK